MTQSEINIQRGAEKMGWSEEHERVPLKQLLKLLLASNRVAVDLNLETKEVNENVVSVFNQEPSFVQTSVKTEDEYADINVDSSSAICSNAASLVGLQAIKSERETSEQFLDELDHVSLQERLRRLLKSKCLGQSSLALEESSPEVVRGKPSFDDEKQVVFGSQEFEWTFESGSSNVHKSAQTLGRCSQRNILFDSRNSRNDVGRGKSHLSDDTRTAKTNTIPTLANIKIEPLNYGEFQSYNETTLGQMSFGNFVLVKNEVQSAGDASEDEVDHMLLRERMNLSSRNCPSLDTKNAGDASEDKLDCMLLRERMKLLSFRNFPSLNHQSSNYASEMLPPDSGHRPVESKPAPSVKINRLRKRRKTATDSIETAMEEDAPGLLQVLIEKGVSVNEIKLYGEPESNDALDDSTMKDTFSELEEVITKLFSQRDSLLKNGPVRFLKEEKASYCLECLFSLVEQARYVQFRQWPVEWGWCRDLQSFIFVFKRHNRIVLERPEYGYATYFFELIDSLPMNWQIRRLVTAMKLTNYSRITLIENKPLMVGNDLTEGEAAVLMEYGWILGTGLGTMLNYYDRVYHDRRNERDRCEWRLKIGKLLADGYNGGTLIPSGIPSKVMEYNAEQVKLEAD